MYVPFIIQNFVQSLSTTLILLFLSAAFQSSPSDKDSFRQTLKE